MKKRIIFTLALMSISLINARTRTRTRYNDPDINDLLIQAAVLDHYAQLSFDELQAGKGEEAWDIIGHLQDALRSVNSTVAQEIIAKIENYKKAEQAKLATS